MKKLKFVPWFWSLSACIFSPLVIASCAQNPSSDLAWPFATNLTKVSFNWAWQPYLKTMQTNSTNINKAISIPLGWFATLSAKAANLSPEAINYQWLKTWFQVDILNQQPIKIDVNYLNRIFNQDQSFKKAFFQFCFGTNGWFSPLVQLANGAPYQSLINGKLVPTDQFDWIEFVQVGTGLKMYCYIIDQTGKQALIPFWSYPSNQDGIITNRDHFQFDLKIPLSFVAIDQNQIASQQVISNQAIDYQVDEQIQALVIHPFNQTNTHFNNLKNYLLKQNIQIANQPKKRVVLAYLSGTTNEQLLPVAILEQWLEQRIFNSNQQPIQYLIKDHQQVSLDVLNSDLFVTINGWSNLNKVFDQERN